MNDFDLWNKQKQHINICEKGRYCKPREVWWCNLGLNIGHEENGKGNNYRRPVLILKRFSSDTVLIAPLTKSKNNHKFKIPLGNIRRTRASIILSQIKVIDTRRCTIKIFVINKNIFNEIKKTLKQLI